MYRVKEISASCIAQLGFHLALLLNKWWTLHEMQILQYVPKDLRVIGIALQLLTVISAKAYTEQIRNVRFTSAHGPRKKREQQDFVLCDECGLKFDKHGLQQATSIAQTKSDELFTFSPFATSCAAPAAPLLFFFLPFPTLLEVGG